MRRKVTFLGNGIQRFVAGRPRLGYILGSPVGLALLGGCAAVGVGAGAALVIGLLTGLWLGQIRVVFPEGSLAARLSDGAGQARIRFDDDGSGQPSLRSYEGLLPGFLESGAT